MSSHLYSSLHVQKRLGSIEGLIKKARRAFRKSEPHGPRRIKVGDRLKCVYFYIHTKWWCVDPHQCMILSLRHSTFQLHSLPSFLLQLFPFLCYSPFPSSYFLPHHSSFAFFPPPPPLPGCVWCLHNVLCEDFWWCVAGSGASAAADERGLWEKGVSAQSPTSLHDIVQMLTVCTPVND